MPSRKNAKLTFASAIIFLFVAGAAAGIAIVRLTRSLQWVAHTYDVQVALGDIGATMTVAGRVRSSFDTTGAGEFSRKFDATAALLPGKLNNLARLVSDNPAQSASIARLRDIENRRLAVLNDAIHRRERGPVDEVDQKAITRQVVELGNEADSVTQEMLDNEQRLLVFRRALSTSLYTAILYILVVAFIVSLALFYAYYRLLEDELTERERAEGRALESQAAARDLSMRLLHVQDEERRKFSRELHDSLGQYLAAAKMSLDALVKRQGSDELLTGALSYLEQAMTETRTISYLLHPPQLDEAGVGNAARGYLEGFSQRSGIQIQCEIAENFPRLPRHVELALFRVLQECLTNIHRHAKSDRAEVTMRWSSTRASLQVRDYGHGIAPEILDSLRDGGSQVGVGLSGMRERIREQGGTLEVQSGADGVTVLVAIPLLPQQAFPEAPSRLSSAANI